MGSQISLSLARSRPNLEPRSGISSPKSFWWNFPALHFSYRDWPRGVYPIARQKRTWFLDEGRKRPCLGVSRRQLPLPGTSVSVTIRPSGIARSSLFLSVIISCSVNQAGTAELVPLHGFVNLLHRQSWVQSSGTTTLEARIGVQPMSTSSIRSVMLGVGGEKHASVCNQCPPVPSVLLCLG